MDAVARFRPTAVARTAPTHHAAMSEWKALLERLDVAIVVQEPDLRITYSNAKAAQLVGISRDEMVDRTADDARWDVVDAEGRPVEGEGHPGVKALRTGQPVRGVLLGVRRGDSAERVWIIASAVPDLGPDGRVLRTFVSFTDVNAVQQAIREQEATFRTVFDSMSEGLAVHEPDGRIRMANSAAERVLGLSVAQMTGREATDPRWRLIRPDGEPAGPDDIPSEIAARTGQAVPARLIGVHRPSGEVAWLSVRADPLRDPGHEALRGVVATFTDVTEQRRTELALEESRAHLQRVIDAVPGIVYQYLHPESGPDRMEIVGGRVDELLGISADVARGDLETLFALISETERRQLEQRIGAAVSTGARFEHDVAYRHPDGSLRWMHIHAVPQRTAEGLLYTGVILDVTEAHRLADALRRAQRREAMGELAAGIAHNFNNMLAVILPNLEMARDEASAAARELLDDASRAAMSAAELVSRMLTLGRAEGADAPVTCDLAAVVRESVQFCRSTFDRAIRIEDRCDVGEAWVRGSASAMQQVVLNLCLNARDALAGRAEQALRVELRPDGEGAVVLSVRDSGHGMSDETLRRIGEPFYTTKARGQGTGLGLATAFQTVGEAGGTWRVESRHGEGTMFELRFPLVAAGERRASAHTPASAGGGGLVLVVDDEPLVRDVMRRQLERAGYRTRTAESGPAVLALLDELDAGEVRAVLLDLSMPEMSGAETLRRLVAKVPDLPVLILSGHVPDPAELAGAAGILQKPVRMGELLAAVERVRAGR